MEYAAYPVHPKTCETEDVQYNLHSAIFMIHKCGVTCQWVHGKQVDPQFESRSDLLFCVRLNSCLKYSYLTNNVHKELILSEHKRHTFLLYWPQTNQGYNLCKSFLLLFKVLEWQEKWVSSDIRDISRPFTHQMEQDVMGSPLAREAKCIANCIEYNKQHWHSRITPGHYHLF